jgi:hypothetical protein
VAFFCEFFTPFTLKGHNFFKFILFLTIFNALDAPIGGVQVFLNKNNNGALSLDLACIERLSVIVVTRLQLMNN